MFAFTLAEVLITLVIIGVIAAITVPSLINKTNNQETVSRLKKAYSTFAQATNLIIAEEGTPRADKGGWATNANNIYKMYKRHLNNAKDCNSQHGCFNQGTYKFLNGDEDNRDYNTSYDWYKIVLADGVQVAFSNDTVADCGRTIDGISTNVCAPIFVDLNGEKKPNTFGKDVFGFVIKENGLYPNGCDDERYCDAASTTGNFGKGYGCACKVLREGAINY